MTKNRFVVGLMIIFLLLPLAGCQTAPAAPPELIEEWAVTDGITLRLRQTAYPAGTKALTLVLENRTDSVMLYGQGWSFEKYEDGRWTPLTVPENYAFTAEGYVLQDHDRQTFMIPTAMLTEPLDAGLYRVTGCTLRTAADEENLSADGSYADHPAYQLTFSVTEEAQPEPAEELRRADWQWYTPQDGVKMLEDSGKTVWQYVRSEDGLIALLWRAAREDDRPEDDELTLYLYDRRDGDVFAVFDELTVAPDGVTAAPGGGFTVTAGGGTYFAGKSDGCWVTRGSPAPAGAEPAPE